MNFEAYYRTIGLYSTFILVFHLFSHLIKERLYLSESLVSMLVGVAFGPVGLGWLQRGPRMEFWMMLYQLSRIVIAFQIMAASMSLSRKQLIKMKDKLVSLWGPVTLGTWLLSSAIIYGPFGDRFTALESLALGACLTPTDPILASSIVKGKFAEEHIPESVRILLSIESAANDGVALPLLHLPLTIIMGRSLIKDWLVNVVIWKVFGAMLLGGICGWIANRMLRFSERRGFIDKESFVVFSLALALSVAILMIQLGSNDMLAVFMTGVVFAWDDWYSEETRESQIQPVLDSLFNCAFFVTFGMALPWAEFKAFGVGRLLVASAAVLSARRLPFVWTLTPLVDRKERFFVGWFGPIGVGTLFYATAVSLLLKDDQFRFLSLAAFVVMTSVLAHGMTVPLFQLTMNRQVTLDYLRETLWTEAEEHTLSKEHIHEIDFQP